MMEGVRNRVASFEAENEERRKSFGPKSPGALSSSPPQKSRTFLSLSNNPNYSSPQAPASSIDHNDEQDHSNEQQHHHDGHQSSSTSAAASESRKSRLRQQQQQQQVQETVRPTNLMLRKKKLKEQRKSRQFGGSSTTNHHSAPNGESSSSSNIGNNLNRHPNEAGEEESGIHPIDHSESSAQIVTPTKSGEEEQPTFLSEGEAKGGGGGDLDHSPFRKSPGSRITKMQRMQKMKGYEQVKKGQYPHLSSASPPPSVANSNATTAVARNTRGGDGRAVTVAMADPPKSTYSPPPSPVYSDNHTYLDHANTDDDATLTSVHRIMNSEARISSGEAPSKSSRPNSSAVFNTNGMSGPIKSNSSYSKHRLNHEYRMGQQGQNQNHHWLDEEKSDKHGEIMYRTPSSSDYDTDGDHSKTSKTSRQSQTSDVNDFFQRSRFQASASRRADDDERTFDYAENDDHSDGSASYATRQQREAEKRAREATGDDINITKSQSSKNNPPPLINKDGVEHYAKSFEDPKMRLGAGVVGAATVGCIILGPLGLLMGAAAVGVGVGVMRIPEEQRNSMQEKAQKKFGEYQEKALEASEKLSNSCANHYKDSVLAEHMPECMVVAGNEVAEHLPQCVSTTDADANNDAQSHVSDKNTIVTKGVPGGSVKGSVVPDGPDVKRETSTSPSGQGLGRFMSRHKKVACLRTGKRSDCIVYIVLNEPSFQRLR